MGKIAKNEALARGHFFKLSAPYELPKEAKDRVKAEQAALSPPFASLAPP
jgi:hypothetical protein